MKTIKNILYLLLLSAGAFRSHGQANNLTLACAQPKNVQCGTAWGFDPPTVSSFCDGGNTNYTLTHTDVTNGTCLPVITRTWTAVSFCHLTNHCSQVVTVVNTNPPAVSVSSSANPSLFGQPVIFTAALTPVGSCGGTPGGTVQFKVDNVAYGAPVALSGGSATITNAALAPGNHTVSVLYAGDGCFLGATNFLVAGQTVNQAGSSTSIASSLNPSGYGQAVAFTATVSAAAPSEGLPSGTVQFIVDGSNLGAPVGLVPTAGDTATITTSTLAAGNHSVTAHYNGDSGFTSSSAALAGGQSVNVNCPPPAFDPTTVRNLTYTACATGPIYFGTPTASSSCCGSTTVVCTPASPVVMAPGVTNIHCVATDCLSNTASANFLISVVAPTLQLTCQDKNVSCEDTNWTFDTPTIQPGCCPNTNYSLVGEPPINNGTRPPSFTKTWIVSDACGNSNSCSQTVLVVNTNQPVFQGASDITLYSCSSTTAVFNVTATEVCCGNLKVDCSPASGSVFAPGTTQVTSTATDCYDYTYSTTFNVNVIQPPLQAISADKYLACGATNWSFDLPSVSDACCPGTNFFYPQPPTTNGTSCPLAIMQVWGVTDTCGNSNYCAQTIYFTNTSATQILPSFNLPAAAHWYDTGSNLLAGENVTITAVGTADVGTPGSLQSPSGSPIGSVNVGSNVFLYPSAPWWSLIGKIGPSGAPFLIGARTNFNAATGGELYLSVNDYNFADNSGFWTVWVQTKMPVVTISNLQAVQRPGTRLLDISYDLNSTVGHPIATSLLVSSNNGANFFVVPLDSVWGNGFGPVMPGNRRKITVDPGAISSSTSLTNLAIEINPENFAPADITGVNLNDYSFLANFIPVVEEVTSLYSSSSQGADFLNHVSLPVAFTATIDWRKSTPGTVEFNSTLYQWKQNASGSKASRTFDVGYDFFPILGTATGLLSTGNRGGGLSVVAVSGTGRRSAAVSANIRVLDPPVVIPPEHFSATTPGPTIRYSVDNVDLNFLDAIPFTIPSDVPAIGGTVFHLNLPFSAPARFNAYGGGIANPPRQAIDDLNLSLGPINLKGYLDANAIWRWAPSRNSPDGNGWVTTTACEGIGIKGEYDSPSIVVGSVFGIPISVSFGAKLDTEIQGCVQGYDNHGIPQFYVTWGPSTVEVIGTLGIGIPGFLDVAVNGGGGVNWLITIPTQPGQDYAQIVLSFSVTYDFFGGHGTIYDHTWCYPLSGNPPDCPQSIVARIQKDIATFQSKPETASSWQLIPRSYLDQPYASFNNAPKLLSKVKSDDASSPLTLTSLESNVSPHSQPALAVSGTNQMLLWVLDDPARAQVNGSKLVWSKWDGNAWSSPEAVWDDGTADFHPTVQWFGNGGAVAVWENERSILDTNAALPDILAGMEIAAAVYDPFQGWISTPPLAANSYLDWSPRLSAASNGHALVTWISNPYNSMLGSSSNQNTVNGALWDGSVWQPAGPITTSAGMLLASTVAFDGTNGVFLAVIDADDDATTLSDQQLWGATYSNGTWSAFTQLTANGVQNANPQAVYDSTGQLLVAWYQGSNIVTHAGDLNLNSSAIAATFSSTSLAKAFRLVTGPAGQISMVWDDRGLDGTGQNPFLLNYDPTLQVWSQPIQLLHTSNKFDTGFSGGYTEDGTLLVAYDQTAILTNGNSGEVDLMLMSYQVGSDLAVSSGNISLSIPNPAPGQSVIISAVVQNLGELAATNVQVAFYAGDPSAGGVSIASTQTVAGVLAAGSSATVHVNWGVPAVAGGATIYVVVDPNLTQPDRNLANNAASLTAMAPDLAIASMGVLTGDPTNPVITASVVNRGAATSGHSVDVVFHQDAQTGPALGIVTLPELEAGGSYDATIVWPMAGMSFTSAVVTVYAVVDPTGTVSEFSGVNPAASAPVPTPLAVAPPALTAVPSAYNQISLGWPNDSGNVSGYIVSRSANGGAYSVIARPDPTQTNLTDSTVSCGNSYVYMIAATNSFGVSDPVYVSVTTSGLDSEGSGVPDCWRLQYFGHPDARAADLSRALDDADGDGMNNLKEYLTGTSPTNASSVFRVTSVQRQGNDLNVGWQTAGGHTNALQAATGILAGFSNVSPNIVLPGSGDTFTNYLDVGAATNGGPRFYRVQSQ